MERTFGHAARQDRHDRKRRLQEKTARALEKHVEKHAVHTALPFPRVTRSEHCMIPQMVSRGGNRSECSSASASAQPSPHDPSTLKHAHGTYITATRAGMGHILSSIDAERNQAAAKVAADNAEPNASHPEAKKQREQK